MLLHIFKKSFKLLAKEPKIFIPRIFTTLLYTVFLLYSAKLILEVISIAAWDILEIRQLSGKVFSFFIFFLLIYGIDILCYGMYAKIAQQYHKGKRVELLLSFKEAVHRIWTLFSIGIVVLVFGFFFISICLILEALYVYTHNFIFPLLALAAIPLSLILFAIFFFFAVPVAVTKKCGVKEAVSRSVKLGMRNKGPVLKTNFFFVALIILTLLVAVYTGFKGKIGAFAVFAFIIGRLFQSIVYTYISIVNPTVYLYVDKGVVK